jgi:cardiolipin synthase (CMP-forming)
MTLPNLISLARLIMVPLVIVAILQERWMLAFCLFVTAGVSDAVDGYIARRFDMRSALGAFIDPLADKALLISIFITLAVIRDIPFWLAVIVVFRDLVIMSAIAISWLMHKPVTIEPLMISKVNTAAQIAFAAIVLSTKAFGIELVRLDDVVMVTLACLTGASAVAYLTVWLKHMAA